MSKYCKWCTRYKNNKCEIVHWLNDNEFNIHGHCGFMPLYNKKPTFFKRIIMRFRHDKKLHTDNMG